MNDGELSLLRLIDQKIDRLQASFDRHAEEDNRRFDGHGRRIGSLETAEAVNRDREINERTDETRWHNWQIALLGALAVIAASLVSAVATAHLMGTH